MDPNDASEKPKKRGHPWPGPHPERQCTAHNRRGERCQKEGMLGLTVCAMHGGKTPNAQAAAREKLMALAEPSVDFLKKVITEEEKNEKPCPLCGRGMELDPGLKSRVAFGVLDRTGLGPTSKIEVEHKNDDGWVDYCTADEAEQLYSIMARARERMGDEVGTTPTEEAVH